MVKLDSLLVAVCFGAVAFAADVPTAILRHSVNTSVTNKDIVTLAKAGFDEEFIIRTVLGAHCSCDTTSDALATLAEQGISQRVIEVMLDSSYAGPTGAASVASVGTAPVNSLVQPVSLESGQAVMSTPAMARPIRQRAVRPSLAAMAISGRVPYSEEQSVFWGLWRKKKSVTNAKAADQPPQPSRMVPLQVNERWQQVSAPNTDLALPRSSTGRVWHTAMLSSFGRLVTQ